MAHPELLASARNEYRKLKSNFIRRLLAWLPGGRRHAEKAIQYLKRLRIYGQVTDCQDGDDGGTYQATIPLDLLSTRKCANLLRSLICLHGGRGNAGSISHTIHKRPDFEAEIVLQRVGDDLFQVYYRCSRQGSYY